MKIASYYMVSKNVLNSALLFSSDIIIDTKDRATIPNVVTYKEKPQQGFFIQMPKLRNFLRQLLVLTLY